jgi:hypothetical protein
MGAGAVDGFLDQRNLPLDLRVYDRPLDQYALAIGVGRPFEAALAVLVAQQRQVGAARRGRWTRGAQGREGIGRAVAVLATDLDRVGDLTVDQAVAVVVLREVTVGALQALLGVNVHHVDRLALLFADGGEFGHAVLAELLGIVGRDDLAGGVEQIALAIALVDRAEVPAMAVIVGELGVLRTRIDVVIDVAREVEVAPFADRGGAFRVALIDAVALGHRRILLLFRPHQRRIGLIIPHRVAEVGIEEDVGLVHVAVHALRGRDRLGEGVLDRVALFLRRADRMAGRVGLAMFVMAAMPAVLRLEPVLDRRIDRRGLTIAAIYGVDQAVGRLAVVRVDDVAARTARTAIVARLIIGAHEPHEWIIEARLVEVEHGDGDAQAGAGAAVRLLELRAAGFLEALDAAARVGQADLGEGAADRTAAALEHAEDVGGGQHVPGRQRIDDRSAPRAFCSGVTVPGVIPGDLTWAGSPLSV